MDVVLLVLVYAPLNAVEIVLAAAVELVVVVAVLAADVVAVVTVAAVLVTEAVKELVRVVEIVVIGEDRVHE